MFVYSYYPIDGAPVYRAHSTERKATLDVLDRISAMISYDVKTNGTQELLVRLTKCINSSDWKYTIANAQKLISLYEDFARSKGRKSLLHELKEMGVIKDYTQ